MDSGLIRPSADPRSRAVVLMLWSLGALAMNRHLERLLGVDLTSPDADLSPYARPILELYAQGLLTAAAAEHAVAARINRAPQRTEGMSMKDIALHTEGLTKHYGDVKALIDLDLDVHRGEVFGFLGPNGAGKTTTIRTVMDEIRPTAGQRLDPRHGLPQTVGGDPPAHRLSALGPGPVSEPDRQGHVDVLRQPPRRSRVVLRRRTG
ncbi:MAG: ATP-binding cassette domain-containing protein [Candidatus Nanopelagicales bacterium]